MVPVWAPSPGGSPKEVDVWGQKTRENQLQQVHVTHVSQRARLPVQLLRFFQPPEVGSSTKQGTSKPCLKRPDERPDGE